MRYFYLMCWAKAAFSATGFYPYLGSNPRLAGGKSPPLRVEHRRRLPFWSVAEQRGAVESGLRVVHGSSLRERELVV